MPRIPARLAGQPAWLRAILMGIDDDAVRNRLGSDKELLGICEKGRKGPRAKPAPRGREAGEAIRPAKQSPDVSQNQRVWIGLRSTVRK